MSNDLTRDKALTDDEQKRLIDFCNRYPCRDSTMILTALATGARPSELLAIHLNDLNPTNHSLYIRSKKGGRHREIPMEQTLFDNLYQLALNSPSGLPFPIKKTRLFTIWDQYRINNKKLYSLRHSAAVRVYKQTKDVKIVQYFLGHRSMINTMIYIDFCYGFEELRNKLILRG